MAKRTTRRNVYGNVWGYIGGKKTEPINGQGIDAYSDAERKASEAWIAGREDWQNAAWEA